MKRFFIIAIFVLLVLGIEMNASAVLADTWNITVQTGQGPPTIPFNSTGLLTLQNFSVSALATLSNMTFNSTISELSFLANVTAEEGTVQGQNINITMPTSFANGALYQNETILVYISVDGQGNGFTLNQENDSCVLGFYLYEGNHTVSLDIYLDPPIAVTVDESPLILMLGALATLPLLCLMKARRKQRALVCP